jgi:hypothetical protein
LLISTHLKELFAQLVQLSNEDRIFQVFVFVISNVKRHLQRPPNSAIGDSPFPKKRQALVHPARPIKFYATLSLGAVAEPQV